MDKVYHGFSGKSDVIKMPKQGASKVSENKKKEVENLKHLIKNSKAVAIAGIRGIPSPQLQDIRRKLRGKATIKVSKNSMILKAIEAIQKDHPGIDSLKERIEDQSVVIASSSSSYELFRMLKESRTWMLPRVGQIIPQDIVVEAGPTEFSPGPIISELQRAGIPAAIEKGKVVIKQKKKIVEAGNPVSADVVQALKRMEINPIEVGVQLRAAWEEGILFEPAYLEIDIEKTKGELLKAFRLAFSLALSQKWINRYTIPIFISQAYQNAKCLGAEAKIINPETLPLLMMKAYQGAIGLKNEVK
jgi:large subunit ribosomal protein L10